MLESLTQVTVIGAGTMGHGIAHVAASADFEVVLCDVDADALGRGVASVRTNIEKGIATGRVPEESLERIMGRIRTTTSLVDAVQGSGLIVEAVPERLDLKCSIFATLGQCAPEDAVLGTNTSSLSVNAIAEASGRADRVVGLHFFNPVHIMKLLEIVVGESTAADVVVFAVSFANRLGKQPIRVKDVPGFATSRLGIVLAMEAIRMLEDGVASAEDIDLAMELGYRHPMGPLKLTDLVGCDVRLDIARYLHQELGSEAFRPPALLERMVAEGRLGKKVGRGFYDYS